MTLKRPDTPTFPAVLAAVAMVVVGFLVLRWIVGFVINLAQIAIVIGVIAAVVYAVIWLTTAGKRDGD